MKKVRIGAITKEVSEGALIWYLMAGWKVVESKTKGDKKDETNS